jgi:glycosyltransferase involved in cell wall biosynthesis
MGGAERIVLFLANQLQNHYTITIFCYDGKSSFFEIDKNIKVIYPKRIYKNFILKRFISLYNVVKFINYEKPNLVISFLSNPGLYSIIGSLILRVPVIVSERGDPITNSSIFSRIRYFFFNFATAIVFQSKKAQSLFNNNVVKKSTVIKNPITQVPKTISSYSSKLDEIVFLGRFDLKQKRHDILINAFNLIHEKFPTLKINFFGDGPDYSKVVKLVSDLHLEDKIFFHGRTNNVLEILDKYKYFILTSDFEGLPNALIEAMSVGLTVVSTDYSPGSCNEIIDNGVNGIIIEKNNPYELAKSIEYLLSNPDFSSSLALNAKKITSILDSNTILQMWIDLINNTAK